MIDDLLAAFVYGARAADLAGVRALRLTVNGTGLEFDRDYGTDRRTGWSAVVEGSYVAQLTDLEAAIAALREAGVLPESVSTEMAQPDSWTPRAGPLDHLLGEAIARFDRDPFAWGSGARITPSTPDTLHVETSAPDVYRIGCPHVAPGTRATAGEALDAGCAECRRAAVVSYPITTLPPVILPELPDAPILRVRFDDDHVRCEAAYPDNTRRTFVSEDRGATWTEVRDAD
jgi:hypothetical protein